MFLTGETVGLAEWIIDDTSVLYLLVSATLLKAILFFKGISLKKIVGFE